MQRLKRKNRKAESPSSPSRSQQTELALSDIIHVASELGLQYTGGSLRTKGNSLTISLTWQSKQQILQDVQVKLLHDGLVSIARQQVTSDSLVKNMLSFVKQGIEDK